MVLGSIQTTVTGNIYSLLIVLPSTMDYYSLKSCHFSDTCNGYSSAKSMRGDGGYEFIKVAIEKTKLRHKDHIADSWVSGKSEGLFINFFVYTYSIQGENASD